MSEGQKKILELVYAANAAKQDHGPNSPEFKAAQLAAMEEIDRQYDGNPDTGLTEDMIPTGHMTPFGEISVLVQKKGKAPKGKGAKMCSYRMMRPEPKLPDHLDEKKGKLRGAVRGHPENG